MMLCSKCSEVVRPVVAIDIDGTLGDYHRHFLTFAVNWLGQTSRLLLEDTSMEHEDDFRAYAGIEPFRDWCCRFLQIDLTTFRTIKLAYRQGGQKRLMPMYPNASLLIDGLRLAAEVWLTTTRPHDRFDRVDPDTREWLRRNSIEFDGLIYSEDKMDELARLVGPERVAFVLDDQVDVLGRADELFPTGGTVLRRTVWNREVPWPVVVGDLASAGAVSLAHVESWELQHHFDEPPTEES